MYKVFGLIREELDSEERKLFSCCMQTESLKNAKSIITKYVDMGICDTDYHAVFEMDGNVIVKTHSFDSEKNDFVEINVGYPEIVIADACLHSYIAHNPNEICNKNIYKRYSVDVIDSRLMKDRESKLYKELDMFAKIMRNEYPMLNSCFKASESITDNYAMPMGYEFLVSLKESDTNTPVGFLKFRIVISDSSKTTGTEGRKEYAVSMATIVDLVYIRKSHQNKQLSTLLIDGMISKVIQSVLVKDVIDSIALRDVSFSLDYASEVLDSKGYSFSKLAFKMSDIAFKDHLNDFPLKSVVKGSQHIAVSEK